MRHYHGVSSLPRLRVLDASDNEVSSVHPRCGKLLNLRELRVGYNKIANLPKELCRLTQLDVLVLDGNPLKEPLLSLSTGGDVGSVLRHLATLPDSPPEESNNGGGGGGGCGGRVDRIFPFLIHATPTLKTPRLLRVKSMCTPHETRNGKYPVRP